MFQIAIAKAGVPFNERFFSSSMGVVRLYDFESELLFCVERMRAWWRLASKEQFVIARHQIVRDAHQFPEDLRGRFADSNKVAETLAHFPYAIQALENRKQKNDLLRHPFLFLEIASD